MPARPLLTALVLIASAGGARGQDPLLRGIVEKGRLPAMRWARFSDVQPDAAALYARSGWTPRWLAQGRPTASAHALLDVLATVGDRGLRSDDYDAAQLTALAATLDRGGADDEQATRFEVALTIAALRLVTALGRGRISSRESNARFSSPRPDFDPGPLVEQLRGTLQPGPLLSALEPAWPHYQLLKRALARYRALARDSVSRLPRPGPGGVREGSRYAGAGRLRRLLGALGDLDPHAASPRSGDSLLTPELADGVRRFQVREETQVDGVLSDATWRLLTTHFTPRIRQMELALERWRWLPRESGGLPLFISLPAMRLRYFIPPGDRELNPISMSVAIGGAFPKDRPVLAEAMTMLVLQHGTLRFVLPGEPAVYLHGRASHPAPGGALLRGDCIGVADAELLAGLLLRGRTDWSLQRLHAASTGNKAVYVKLHPDVPVIIVYATAVARENGQVFFSRDLFGHDRRLEQLLARGYPYPR